MPLFRLPAKSDQRMKLEVRLAQWLLADAALSHPFWKFSGGTQIAQLLQFMKNMGLVGGLVLLSGAGGAKRR